MVEMSENKVRFRKLIVGVALLLIFPWLFFGGPGNEANRSFKEAWDLGHVLLFFLLAIEMEMILKTGITAIGQRVSFTMAVLLVAAVLIEIIQSLLPKRIVSYVDILNSMAGATVAFLWLFGLGRQGCTRFFFVFAGCFILGVVAIPLFYACLDEYRAKRDFPLLADFESSLELSRWEKTKKIKRVKDPVASGNWSLKVLLGGEKYSGIALHYFPGNWQRMQELRFQVFNPDEPVMLHYRVHDDEHREEQQLYENRYNGRQLLATGWTQIVLPLADIESGPRNRKMNVSQIKGFGLFLVDNPKERVLYLDRVELIE
jgi:VanZ family protein